jgi:hypothetical protein
LEKRGIFGSMRKVKSYREIIKAKKRAGYPALF